MLRGAFKTPAPAAAARRPRAAPVAATAAAAAAAGWRPAPPSRCTHSAAAPSLAPVGRAWALPPATAPRGPRSRRHGGIGAPAAAARAGPQAGPDARRRLDERRAALVRRLSEAGSLAEISAIIESDPEELVEGEALPMALLAVAQAGAGDGDGGGGGGAADVELQEALLDRLVSAQTPRLGTLPLRTVSTLALALANAGYYDRAFYSAAAAAAAAGLAALEAWEAPVVVTVLAAGFSAAGHYEEALFDALAAKARAVQASAEAPAGPAPLLALAAALLEVQHYSPALLDALAASATAAGGAAPAAASPATLPPAQLADLLLTLAFFRAAPRDLVAAATAALARALSAGGGDAAARGARGPEPPGGGASEQLDEEQLSRLMRAVLLLRAAGAPVDGGLVDALATRPPERLLAADHLLSDPALAAEARAQPRGAEWEAAGLLAPAQVVGRLEGALGYRVERSAVVQADGTGGRGEGGARLGVEVAMSLEVPDPAAFAVGAGSGGSGAAAARRIAVAVFDDDSYCAHPPGRLRGGVAVEVLALQSLGVGVVALPVREWQALNGDGAAQDAYLRARILAAIS
ncbi:hypothetical protein Rsub_05516 [Raphidocelis subcapitata]|uniref:RAP domain-containing protein n=1 Tax=Raphidocelis subcapitata TaxID=307507 RepID=A0A2V0NXF7_9CHLO|nr:hypothetical protein Rsub_05516 [Raphidocelis subcapitata]|eukprot:GBF92314.1 hypothetical protein Rsub_05516 [Raphidocelis subcapitata]